MNIDNAIFVSYRREDSRWTIRAAAEKLAGHFGRQTVFVDVDAIEAGDDFIAAIDKALARSLAILVFIGDYWLVNKQGRRRLEDPEDIVRKEIATALERRLRVVPVLIDDARMPSAQDLPSDLEALHRMNAVHLRHADFRGDMESLIEALGRDLKLPMASVPWLDMPWQERSDAVQSAQWLRYWHRHADFVGRQEDLRDLDEFFAGDKRFSWYAITGPGGVGKSRLALESLLRLGKDWHGGFLKEEDRSTVEWWRREWRPLLATAIVVDYAAHDPDWLVGWLDVLCRRHFAWPVRVLLIERATHVKVGEEQLWWKQLTTGRGAALDRVETFHKLDERRKPQPLAIEPFGEADQRSLLRSFLRAARAEIEMPADEDLEFWENMDQLTEAGRPLYIGMAAAAIAAEGIDHIRHWHRGDLLERTLDREQEIWADAAHRSLRDNKIARHAVRLIAIATACGGLKIPDKDVARHVKECLDAAHVLDSDVSTGDLYRTAAAMMSGHTYSLEPDLLGEYFLVTRQWRIPGAEEIDEQALLRADLQCAWDINPSGCAQTIARSMADFSDEWATTLAWLSLLTEDRSDEVDHAFLLALVAADTVYVYRSAQYAGVPGQVYECADKILRAHPESEPIRLVVGSAAYGLGFSLAEQGDVSGAQAAYEKGVALGDGDAASNLGVLLVEQGDVAGAQAVYEKGVALGHGGAAFNLGVVLKGQGDIVGAQAAYEKGVTLGDGHAASNLGVLLQKQGDMVGAQAAYERGVGIGYGGAASNLGVLLKEQGDVAGAKAAYEKGVALGYGGAACNLGVLLKEQGDVAGAKVAYEKGVALGDGGAAHGLGFLAEKQGDMAGAQAAYAKGVELGHGGAASNLGTLLAEQGDVAGAQAAYEKGVVLGHGGAASNLGVLLAKEGDVLGAQAAYAKGVELGHGGAATNLGFLLAEQGDVAGAQVAWEEGIELGDGGAAYNLGVLRADQGDMAGAQAAYEKGVALGDGDAAHGLGFLLAEQGDAAGAQAAWEKGVALGHGGAASNLGFLLARQGEIERGKALIVGGCSDLQPGDNWGLYLRALVHLVDNKMNEARADLVNAIKLAHARYDDDRRDWPNTFNLALYYLAAGEVEKAERLFDEGIAGQASVPQLRGALEDLHDFLIFFPDHQQAFLLKRKLAHAVKAQYY